MNDSIEILPAVHSAFPTSFASKDAYLAFVRSWKHAYRCLSLDLRIRRLESRQHAYNNPAKATHLAQALAKAGAARTALGECAYIAKGHGRYGWAFGSAEATWMIALRAAAKVVAARQMEEARAALKAS